MVFTSRTPLAWLNLTHDPRRFFVALAGVSFAVILMFVETGFQNALFDSTTSLIEQLNADLVLVNKSQYALGIVHSFPRTRLYQALQFEGVNAAYPLYVQALGSVWKNPQNGRNHSIRALAFDPSQPVLLLAGLDDYADALKLPDTALIDERSKKFFGPVEPGITAELNERSVHVVGTFSLGTDFTNDGNLIMSDRNFANYFPRGPSQRDTLDAVDIGLIRLAEDVNLEAVRDALRQGLPDDVAVLTRDELSDLEKDFWRKSTPIGFIFGLASAMGFIVGVIICYQILATDVADHLPEYATLKAIGYRDSYLTGVVMREALWMSVLGFIPGAAASALLYALLVEATGLPMRLTLFRGGLILVLTLVMCGISGVIAIRKVQSADPAEVF